MKLHPTQYQELFERAAKKAGENTNLGGFRSLVTIILEDQGITKQDDGHFTEDYIYKSNLACQKAIELGTDTISFEEQRMDVIARYLNYPSFRDFVADIDELSPDNRKTYPHGKKTAFYTTFEHFAQPYFLRARLPAGILIAGSGYIFSLILFQIMEVNWGLNALWLVGLYIVLGFPLGDLCSSISKLFQDTIFINKKGFPSTYFMLFSHPRYPRSTKVLFRQLVQRHFGKRLYDEAQEKEGEAEAIRLLNDVIGDVKDTVNSPKIFAANMRYGLTRNMMGAALVSQFFIIPGLVLASLYTQAPLLASLIFLEFICLLLLIFRKFLLVKAAESYAELLLSGFITGTAKA